MGGTLNFRKPGVLLVYIMILLPLSILLEILLYVNNLNLKDSLDMNWRNRSLVYHPYAAMQQSYMQINASTCEMNEVENTLLKVAECMKQKAKHVDVKEKYCLKDILKGSGNVEANAAWNLVTKALGHAQNSAEKEAEYAQKLKSMEQKLRQTTKFWPLKDTKAKGLTDDNNTWFMSNLYRKDQNGLPEEFEFPSNLSQGKLLCLQGSHTYDGTKNSYGFAWKDYLPLDAVLKPGLTFVVDNYWDYANPWHGMTALVSLMDWRLRNKCGVPDHLVLYHWGEVVRHMGDWVSKVVSVSLGQDLKPDSMQYGDRPVCLEHAVVHRRGLGSMSIARLNKIFDMVRCKSYELCKLELGQMQDGLNVTLLARSGARSFKNVSAVAAIVQEQCNKIQGCHMQVVHIQNLSFCQQVDLMSHTHVLLTVHGAQLTNIIFMPKGGSILEMYPKGWLQYAGIGQFIYSWLSDWVGLQHEGTWYDTQGPDCPDPGNTLECFVFHKDSSVGVNATHLSKWVGSTLSKKMTSVKIKKKIKDRCDCKNFEDVS